MFLNEKVVIQRAQMEFVNKISRPSAQEGALAFLQFHIQDAKGTLATIISSLQNQLSLKTGKAAASSVQTEAYVAANPGSAPFRQAGDGNATEVQTEILRALEVWLTEALRQGDAALPNSVCLEAEFCNESLLTVTIKVPLF